MKGSSLLRQTTFLENIYEINNRNYQALQTG